MNINYETDLLVLEDVGQSMVGHEYAQGLIIGRFQPFCTHHIDLLEQAGDISDIVCVGIGRPNYKKAEFFFGDDKENLARYTAQYIFNYDRTKEIIQEGVNYALANRLVFAPIQDIFDKEKYADHVIKQFQKKDVDLGHYAIIGENGKTNTCFYGAANVVRPEMRIFQHATNVRRGIIEGKTNGLAITLKKDELELVKTAQRIIDAPQSAEFTLKNSWFPRIMEEY